MPSTKTQDPEMSEFEAALLRSVDQALRGEGRVHTPEQIMARRAGGRPRQEVHKQPVTLRLDPDVLARWRASGKGWQTRAAQALAAMAP
ncbi:MAG: BrnA antitoxin family protein [Ottowia sp.]|uniref:BrnA antitoxin family protein n=1 Tax=Ottowia sp. TaxID=1898956 RepID=UPI0039E6C805